MSTDAGVTDPTLDYILLNSGGDIPGGVALNYLEASEYVQVATTSTTFDVQPLVDGSSSFFDLGSATINVEDGQSWTVIFFGRWNADESANSIAVQDTTSKSQKATVTVSHAGYRSDLDDRVPYNVHVKFPVEPVDSSSLSISSLDYGESRTASKTYSEGFREIRVMSEDDRNTIASLATQMMPEERIHVVLVESEGGGSPFSLVRLYGEIVISQDFLPNLLHQAFQQSEYRHFLRLIQFLRR